MRACALGTLLVMLLSKSVSAADFRIESKVYVGEAKAPASANLTLFYQHAVYDFFDGPPREVTIYDPRQRQFTLLDVGRKVRTRIPEETLLAFVAGIKVRAEKEQVRAAHGGALIHEAAFPKFELHDQPQLRTLALDGQRIRYVAQGEEFPNEETARQYYEFADMYARVNATRKGVLPPFARLELNKALAERQLMPVAVTRTLKSQSRLWGEAEVARSEHVVTWRLLRSDEERIDEANAQRFEFKAVAFDEFRQLDK